MSDVLREHEKEHLRNMRLLSEDDRRTLEHLAAKWAAQGEISTLPSGVIPIRRSCPSL